MFRDFVTLFSYTVWSRAIKFGTVRCLANGHLLPEFGERWPTFSGSKNFPQWISRTLFVGALWNLAALTALAYKVLRDFSELWSAFSGSTNFRQLIFHTLLVATQLNLAWLGVSPIDTHIPNFVNFGAGIPWYHAATCISLALMHMLLNVLAWKSVRK